MRVPGMARERSGTACVLIRDDTHPQGRIMVAGERVVQLAKGRVDAGAGNGQREVGNGVCAAQR